MRLLNQNSRIQKLGRRRGSGTVRARAAGSAAANSADKGNRPSRSLRSSKILNNAICNSTSAFRLLKALFDFYVDAESSVLIPQSHNGDVRSAEHTSELQSPM